MFFPHIPLPPIPGPIKDLLGAASSALNPLDMIARGLKALYNLAAWYIEYLLAHPPQVRSSSWTDYIYGNAIGLAGAMVVLTTIVCLGFAMFRLKKSLSVIEAIICGLAVTAGAPLFFYFWDTLFSIGATGTKTVNSIPMGSHETLLGHALNSITNPWLLAAAFGPTTAAGAAVVSVMYAYLILAVFLKVVTLPFLALRPLNDKMKDLSNWTFSAAIVCMCVGLPAMAAVIKISQWVGNNLLGGSAAGTAFCVFTGFGLALYVQYKLYKQAQRVVSRVTGHASTRSEVRGKVDSTVKNKPKVDVSSVNKRHGRTMVPIGVGDTFSRTPSRGAQVRSMVSTEAKQQAKVFVAKKLAVKAGVVAAGTASGGTATAAAVVASHAAQVASGTRRTSPSAKAAHKAADKAEKTSARLKKGRPS